MKGLFMFLFLGGVAFGCSSSKRALRSGIRQGIEGYVYEISGNQMPSPDVKPLPPKGLSTTVYIYELTNVSQTERINTSPFYKTIRTRFIQSVLSDSTGHFAASLPEGRYSLFTKSGEQFYANSFDAANNIAAVEVTKNNVSPVSIKRSMNAVF